MTKDLSQTQIFTTGQIAELLHVAPRTASKWFDAGRLKGYRIPGSMDRRTTREYLIQFLKENGLNTALEKLTTPTEKDNPLVIARNATNLLQEQGGEKLINLLAGMMRTCCTKCGIHHTCEFAYDAYNINCEPKIDCLATK